MRAMTEDALCLHLSISTRTWRQWAEEKNDAYRPDLAPVIERARTIIRDQKFAGAAAGLLNPILVARDLGLADKQEISGPNGGPIESITPEMTPEEASEIYRRTREG
jgi:hypothetical protein